MTMRLGILGAGAWGTALAQAARQAGSAVVLWARNPDLAAEIAGAGENRRYLPGIALDPGIDVNADLNRAAQADALLLVAPAQHTRALAAQLVPLVSDRQPLVVCAKGIEQESGLLMSQVLAEVLPGRPLAVLSGPTFAAEVARGLPAAITLACDDASVAERLTSALGSRAFRPYLSDDLVGAQIGGAVKNVLAIACGIIAGRQLGDNARAALITRGLAEIVRLGLAKGGQRDTLMGLSGLGDLLLTCSALQSRNYSLGHALGEGGRLEDILAARHTVAEGVYSASAVTRMAAHLEVEMPIAGAVDQVIDQAADIDQTIAALLARPFKAESY